MPSRSSFSPSVNVWRHKDADRRLSLYVPFHVVDRRQHDVGIGADRPLRDAEQHDNLPVIFRDPDVEVADDFKVVRRRSDPRIGKAEQSKSLKLASRLPRSRQGAWCSASVQNASLIVRRKNSRLESHVPLELIDVYIRFENQL